MMKNIHSGTMLRVGVACLFTVALHAQVAPPSPVLNSKIETVATLPAPGNTENIAQGQDGSFYSTSLSERILWKVSPTGTVEKFFTEPSLSAFVGVATNKNEIVLGVFQRPYLRPNSGGQPGGRAQLDMSNVGSQVLVLDKKGKLRATIDGQPGQFFNGIAWAGDGTYLITDTAGTAVLRLDTASKKIEPWLKIQAQAVQGNIYMLTGAGGNVTVQVGEEGVLVVDTQFEPMAPKILVAIRKISDKPIRYIINTHVHPDHTGGNEALAKAGASPRGAGEPRAWVPPSLPMKMFSRS
jgi:hypothetical protein